VWRPWLFRIPFDAKLLLQQFPPPYSLETLILAAQALGLEGTQSDWQSLEREQLRPPCLVLLPPLQESAAPEPDAIREDSETLPLPSQETAGGERDTPSPLAPLAAEGRAGRGEGASVDTNFPAGLRLALLARVEAGNAHYFLRDDPQPHIEALATLQPRALGPLVSFRKKPEPLSDTETGQAPQPFGFRWFVPELLKHRRLWRDVLLASLAIQILALATPIFTQVIIDKVVVHHTVNTLVVIALALFASMLFGAALSWIRQYLVLHTGNRVDVVLGTRVFDHLFKLPVRYTEQRPTGVIVARVHGVETIREFVSGAAVTLLLDLPFLFIFLAIMFAYAWKLTLVALGFLGVIVALSLAIVPTLRRRINEQFLLGARNQSFVTEYVAGFETVKSLQMEPQLKRRFGDYLASYLAASFNTRQLSNSYNVAATTLEQLMTLSILILGAWLVMQGKGFTIGMLVAFQMFAGRLSQPMLRIAGLWQEFQQAAIAVKRLGDIMDAPAEPYALTPSRETKPEGRIEIEGLSFRYGTNLPYLYQDFSLEVEPGSCVAILGPSGCGKSTLAKLLQGFYWPEAGSIRIDGHDIRHLSANELRGYLGVVPQETTLFSGTIYENLILASAHATFEQVVQACKMAEIHDVIQALPEGYQTKIGEHGAGLSGGQKQRIAIARALLKRPKILIFDEATSSLDQETSEQLAATVNRLKRRVTMLLISHQLPARLSLDAAVRLGSTSVSIRGHRNREPSGS
jgi:subfamily B ATP-binding cassette protein HlyB/CyaB